MLALLYSLQRQTMTTKYDYLNEMLAALPKWQWDVVFHGSDPTCERVRLIELLSKIEDVKKEVQSQLKEFQ